MHKLLAKNTSCAKKEQDEATGDRRGKCHDKSELHHERCYGQGKHHAGKRKKKFVTTMAFVTMTQRNVTIIKLTGVTFSPLTASQKSRGSSKSALLRMPRGVPRGAA
eukprot:9184599-Ditylum_brightwellii.AAC.1